METQIKVGDYIECKHHSLQTYKVISVSEKEIVAKSPWGSELTIVDFSKIEKVEKPALWDKLATW